MRQPSYFSPAEWEVLQYVTEHAPVPARVVAESFKGTHGHARTTVLTLLERLRKKGYVVRSRVNGLHHYSPSASRADLFESLVRDFVEKALGGSVSPFVAYLSRQGRFTETERAELRRLVEAMDRETEGDDAPG